MMWDATLNLSFCVVARVSFKSLKIQEKNISLRSSFLSWWSRFWKWAKMQNLNCSLALWDGGSPSPCSHLVVTVTSLLLIWTNAPVYSFHQGVKNITVCRIDFPDSIMCFESAAASKNAKKKKKKSPLFRVCSIENVQQQKCAMSQIQTCTG